MIAYRRSGRGTQMDEADGGERNEASPDAGFLSRHGELLLYLAAGVAYITLGLFVKQALALWIEGAAFLLVAVWLLPALVRRLRRLL
jgi:hypothetical protein